MATPALVALDVDGTLLDYDEHVSDRVRAAVRGVVANGNHVVVATGRSLPGTLPVLRELGLTQGYAVCSNGAVTVRLDPSLDGGHEVVDAVTFDPTTAIGLVRAQLPTALFAVEVLGEGVRVNGHFPAGELSGRIDVVPFERLVDGPTTRVVVRSPEHTSSDFLALVERIGLHGVSYSVGWTAWLDLAPDGVDKGSALELVRQRLGVDPSRTVAIGDGRNDLEMFAWAARSVAMANASEQVRAAAGEVCPSVLDDGAAQVLESI